MHIDGGEGAPGPMRRVSHCSPRRTVVVPGPSSGVTMMAALPPRVYLHFQPRDATGRAHVVAAFTLLVIKGSSSVLRGARSTDADVAHGDTNVSACYLDSNATLRDAVHILRNAMSIKGQVCEVVAVLRL